MRYLYLLVSLCHEAKLFKTVKYFNISIFVDIKSAKNFSSRVYILVYNLKEMQTKTRRYEFKMKNIFHVLIQ